MEFSLRLLCESDEKSEDFQGYYRTLRKVLLNWMGKRFFLLKLRNYLMNKTVKLIKLVYNFALMRHYKNEKLYTESDGERHVEPLQL